jgi:hypothetical protein
MINIATIANKTMAMEIIPVVLAVLAFAGVDFKYYFCLTNAS